MKDLKIVIDRIKSVIPENNPQISNLTTTSVTSCRRSCIFWMIIFADCWVETDNKLMLDIIYSAAKKSEPDSA